ncbi:RNA polymerase sigma-70 factor (ECF subfamily) [Rhodopirellula rubra]|uniref:RNA polymerase sigma-70 factor (ECF subfamily) n=1 Tax=Aporhodopirellula rubra TaxID=980271 RepID=A0A7W5DYA8_9BACT|nr:RNA polymerase sigma factor [Aporhodopirellula rubra]MBB3206760.1 RNA polymerase sigma-70 factor (ECF subfamily) [Aporhodopirellula rubra]
MNANVVDQIYRNQSRQVFATLVRLLGDFDLAEEVMHEAFAAAIQKWPEQGTPANPVAWLVSTARFKAVDNIRRRRRLSDLQPELARRVSEIEEANDSIAEQDIKDDRLRLIFTCCHPAIDPQVQVPLTLREVCGLTTEEIARAFLVPPSTLAQRIVRGKSKIRNAKIPFSIPSLADLPERLDSVLSVIYLVFNEGYSASSGDSLTRVDLSDEAIRLARLLMDLLPQPEVAGLLALMLLHESRRTARTDSQGDIVLLEDQDRRLWDQTLIAEGKDLIERSLLTRRIGVYTIQAAISAVHADAKSANETDWEQIVALYDVLLKAAPSPIVKLNRAVAVAMRDGVEVGLAIIDELMERGQITDYHLAHSARGELLRRLGRTDDALQSFEQALSLAKLQPERRFLRKKLDALRANL